MNTTVNSDVITIRVSEDIQAGLAVNFAGGVAKTEKALGICIADTDSGDVAPVKVLGACFVSTGAAVKKGDKLVADAAGKMIKATAEAYYEGYALEDGTNSTVMIRGI